MRRLLTSTLLAALVLAAVSAVRASADTVIIPDVTTLQAAIDGASGARTIEIAAGTSALAANINVNQPNITIQGAGTLATRIQVSGTGYRFSVTSPGCTIRNLEIEKTDTAGPQEIIWINASNVTVQDNKIHGQFVIGGGDVSRAMVVSAGNSGLLIAGNTIYSLRQPAYFSGSITPSPAASVSSNYVYLTKGWVIEGGNQVFTGNTWGTGANANVYDVAILAGAQPAFYTDIVAMSNANNAAVIEDQRTSPRILSIVAVNAAAPAPPVGDGGGAVYPYQTITPAIARVAPGGTIRVAAGTYTEQVVVDGKNLTIQGAGRAVTTIQSPVSLASSFTTSAANFPVMLLENASDIRVSNLTVDGMGRGNSNYRFMGVAFWNAGGKLLDSDVLHVRETPFNGDQHGNAVYAYNITGGPYAIEVGGCNVSDFQKNGITMNGTGLTGTIHDCTVVGQGATGVTAQNGIQVGYGASGALTNCAVSDIGYTGTGTVACGVLMFDGTMTVSGGSVTNCQIGYRLDDVNGSLTNTSVSSAFAAGVGVGSYPAYGMAVYNWTASAPNAATRVAGGPEPSHPVASPVNEVGGAAPHFSGTAVASAEVVTITGGCISGSDLTDSEGIDVWSAGGPLAVTASGIELKDWDYGVVVSGAGVSMNANHNAITSNVSAGYYGFAGPSHTAQLNWWGDASGPAGAGPGTGDVVTGATVVFSPWLITGADANPGCGFAAGPDNAIAAGPAPSCLSIGNSCITIPVSIARTTADGARGYSVTVQLSSNLMLCSGLGSITEGTYLSSPPPGTTFQKADNTGGSYTVDGAILGQSPPCGATAATGTLFNLHVMKAPGGDGTGTITVGDVVLRDCDNSSIVSTAGAPLSITIDTGSPSAIVMLSAPQKKTGNDANGTTQIQLNFTVPGDAATVEVYRAPFGHYPEYDDDGGAVPAPPSYPLPLGSPWTLTGVTTSGQFDEPATRDFWYYVAFAKDACGNVSAVSSRTGGTLNYHLGDVTGPSGPGTGNNQVGTVDITLLAASYGHTLLLNAADNYLDVGPTTDMSVNGRPTTDNKIGFEDLILFAINFGTVTAPQDRPALVAARANALTLTSAAAGNIGETFTLPVQMAGAGDVQGASMAFTYDPAVVEFVSAEAGELLRSQGRQALVLSPSAGVVDFALLGEGAGVQGEGVLVNATFRRIAAGEPGLALKSVMLRNAANQPVGIAGAKPALPTLSMLGSAYPNPFRGRTSLQLSLAREGHVRVAVYDLVGRRMRTLVNGVQPAGEQTIAWDGRDDSGRAVAAGLYLVRFDTPGAKQSRRLVLMP